jgi:hypothetical protein
MKSKFDICSKRLRFPAIAVSLLASVCTQASEVPSSEERASRLVSVNTSPMSYLTGGYNLGLQIYVSDRLTLGPKGYLYDFSQSRFRDGYRLGVRTHYFFGDHWQGSSGVVKLGVYWDHWDQTSQRSGAHGGPSLCFADCDSVQVRGVSFDALVGYQWSIVRDRMTLDLGGGLEWVRNQSERLRSVIPRARPVIEAAVGVSF